MLYQRFDAEDGPGIYCIVNTINGKTYVGQSNTIKTRLLGHRQALIQNRHEKPDMQADWNAQGGQGFEFGIVEMCATDRLRDLEYKCMKMCGATNPASGYNGARNDILKRNRQ